MSNDWLWKSVGREIRDAVETALETGNFKDISDVMKNTGADIANNVSSAVEKAVTGAMGGAGGASGVSGNRTARYEQATLNKIRAREAREKAAKEAAARAAAERRKLAPFRKIGRISNILYRIFGGIGTGVMGILSAVFGGLALGLGGGWRIAFSVVAIFLILFVCMISVGYRQKKRLMRAQKYVELAGANHYINLDELSLHTGKPKKFVLKDVKAMIESGLFPEGHLDVQESCLMLNDGIYREYLELQKQRRIQEREQREQELKNSAQKKKEIQTEERDELAAMIEDGQGYIRQLRELNDNIPGEEISAKLFRLENLLKQIFEGLREHPQQMSQMRKFMNYYLPTTMKLVAAYEEFDDLEADSEEVQEAKTEIEKTLDTINGAFAELLNRILRSTAYDVTTDAQVLQTMLAQEGLTKNKEFEKVPRD